VSAAALAALLAGCALLRPSPPSEAPIYTREAGAGSLVAGAAVVDVTPVEAVWLAGYHPWRRSHGVHDPIYARALVVEKGGLRLGFVAIDVIGIQRQDVLRMRGSLEKAGFDPRHVILHSTHNHSGPDTLGLWGLPPLFSGKDRGYMERLEAGILEALQRARQTLRPAELAAGAIRIDPRGIMKNLRRPGLVDRELVALHLREHGGGPTIATLVELGCHPEVLGPENDLITADFPAWVVAALEEELGGVGIHVSGALGGLVTPDIEDGSSQQEGGDWAEAEQLGRRVAQLALQSVATFEHYEAQPRIVVWRAPLYLRNQNFIYDLARWTGVLDRQVFRGGYLLSEVNLWEIGRLRVATVPGEITPDLGLRIKQTVGGAPTLLVGLANDELGYLIPQADFELPIYEYERTVSPGPDGGDRVWQAFQDLRLLVEADAPAEVPPERRE
jgi:hypothetical protein